MRARVLALALLCAGPVFAQSAPSTSAASREAAHMNNLATVLDLTDTQKAQVQTILDEEHTQMRQSIGQAMASGAKPDFQQMKALHQQIQQQTLQKLSTVLSATQLKKFQALSQMSHHGHFNRGGPPGNTATPASSS
jgi:hypothetical protein